ncbi:hypothetical protein [Parasphingorhabdus halotolerans]|uniref:hypothetical protein n=1 Tax=Parasphingorhabdus halotolerans TaxID=2725558 RepID=UPI001B3A0115|nr:hypothetical protein [Parasphingorhabdus halotolerans]
MARLPRIVIRGIPHHVTQRGNRREKTFFEDGDYALYLDLLAEAAAMEARTGHKLAPAKRGRAPQGKAKAKIWV